LSTLRFNRLHFFKRFDPSAEFIVLKNMVVNGVEVKRGERFDKSLMPTHKIKRLFETRKITPEASLYNPADIAAVVEVSEENILTNAQENDIVMPEIRKKGVAWFAVYLGEEQIGKSVRSEDEAQAIVDEWLENATQPNS